jgi:hypothetical protein
VLQYHWRTMQGASVSVRNANGSFSLRDVINSFVIHAAKCGLPHGNGERDVEWINLQMINLA